MMNYYQLAGHPPYLQKYSAWILFLQAVKNAQASNITLVMIKFVFIKQNFLVKRSFYLRDSYPSGSNYHVLCWVRAIEISFFWFNKRLTSQYVNKVVALSASTLKNSIIKKLSV